MVHARTKTGTETTGEFTLPQGKGPEDITLEFYPGTFWEAFKSAKFYGKLATCQDVVQARMDFPLIRDMQRGTWLAEGAVFYPGRGIILVTPNSNPLFKDLKKTEEHFSKKEGLPLEAQTAEELISLCEKEFSLVPEQRNTLLLPWKCYPVSGSIPFDKAADAELARFLFRDAAKDYGVYNFYYGNPRVNGFVFEFKPCEEMAASYPSPFALPIFLSKFNQGSHVEVYEKDDPHQNWNFAIDRIKGLYGIPDRSKEKRLRQFGRILSMHGVEDPQALDDILNRHSQK